MPRPVPLRSRLPNPPVGYCGREAELRALEQAVARSPVVAVAGLPGLGKTALVLQGLLRSGYGPRTLFVPIRPGDLTAQVRIDLLGVLARMSSSRRDFGDLSGDPESVTEAALDLAEELKVVTVFDDVHHADGEEMGELLTQLTTYARTSRFVVTTRDVAQARRVTESVLLGPMGEADLLELAVSFAPKLQSAARATCVRQCGGSPWLLKQLLAGGGTTRRDHVLEGLPREVDSFLATLGLVRGPVPHEIVARLRSAPPAPVLADLERRGLIFRTAEGLRPHELATAVIEPPDAATRRALAEVLGEWGEGPLAVEAVRLWVEAGELDKAVRVLDERVDDVLTQGQAPRLFGVIGTLRDGRLAQFQRRAAVELGNPTALFAVRESAQNTGAQGEVVWVQVLLHSGELAAALELARDERRRAERDGRPEAAFEAGALEARVELQRHHVADAAKRCEELVPANPAQRLEHQLLRWRVAMVAPERQDQARSGELLTLAGQLREDSGIDIELLVEAAELLRELGQRSAAHQLLDVAQRSPRGAMATLGVARRALWVRSALFVDDGRLSEAEALFEQLKPFLRSATLLRPRAWATEISRRLMVGQLSGIELELELAERDAAAFDPGCSADLARLAQEVALAVGVPATRPPLDAAGRWLVARAGLHRGEPLTSTGPDEAEPLARLHQSLALAEHHALRGRHAEAVECATRAAQLAEAQLDGRSSALALSCLADVAGLAGRWDVVTRAATQLSAWAERTGAARFGAEARLWKEASSAGQLELLAASASPVATRRAQALLGAPVGDHLDRRVVAALTERGGWQTPVLALGTHTFPGWGLDTQEKVVWMPGRQVELKQRLQLFRVLEFLAQRGGSADKESMVKGVWAEREYHPGRHDPRLHMTMRKVREAIEEDASNPCWLLTTEVGYRLAMPLRIRGTLGGAAPT